MNRSTDYRVDFYSLGITFYQMLCGKLPFSKKNPMELIHSHLAQEAVSLHEVELTIPEAISDIVRLLMMKNAEDRYQSEHGLLHDLQECKQQLLNTQTLKPFRLRINDFSEKF